MAFGEGKGDEVGEPGLEPDAALTAALASPAPTRVVRASTQLPSPAQHQRMLQDGPCWDTKGVSLLKPAAWDPGRRGDARHRRPAPRTRSWVPPTPLSAEAWSSPLSPSGVKPCLAVPRTGFPAGSGRRQLRGSKCLRRESHAVAPGVAAAPMEPVRNLFAPSLGV